MSTTVIQPQFAQPKPFHYCRNARQTLDKCRDLVIAGKVSYIFKCRNPRCSHECHKAWSNKHSACLNRLLDVYIEMPKYRGCLKLHKDATPEQHARAKRAFLQTMRRWAERRGVTFAIHATMHITSPTDAHWDCVAYSDAPVTPLKAAVSAAWSRAGGSHQSLMPLDDDEIAAQCRYAAKDLAPKRQRGPRYLPMIRPKGERGGINHQWYSAGFWKGHKVAELWHECIEKWKADGVFGDPASNTEDTTLASPASPESTLGTADSEGGIEAKVVSSVLETDPKLTPKQRAVIAEIDDRIAKLKYRYAANIHGVLPTSPNDAATVEDVASWMDIRPMLVSYRLRDCHMAKRAPVTPGTPPRYYRELPAVVEGRA